MHRADNNNYMIPSVSSDKYDFRCAVTDPCRFTTVIWREPRFRHPMVTDLVRRPGSNLDPDLVKLINLNNGCDLVQSWSTIGDSEAWIHAETSFPPVFRPLNTSEALLVTWRVYQSKRPGQSPACHHHHSLVCVRSLKLLKDMCWRPKYRLSTDNHLRWQDSLERISTGRISKIKSQASISDGWKMLEIDVSQSSSYLNNIKM